MNKNRSFLSNPNSDNRSHLSNQSSARYPPSYTQPSYNQDRNNGHYQDQMSVECFNYENKNVTIDHLPESSDLIQTLIDVQTDLYALCLFDSGSTNTLINHRVVPLEIPVRAGASQSFMTTQGTYESSKIVDG